MDRDLNKYGGQTFTQIDLQTGRVITLVAVPMRLYWYKKQEENIDKTDLTVEVWRSIEDFRNPNNPSVGNLNKTFSMMTTEAVAAYPDFFEAIISSAFEWLGVAGTNFDLRVLDINLTNLVIRAEAINKNTGAEISRKTRNLQEFEDIKTNYPDLVMNYFYLMWTHAKTYSPVFALFN